MARTRITPAQKLLLAEIREAGVLYIRAGTRYDRTVEALHQKGLVTLVEPDYSRHRMNGWALAKRATDG